ncbi:MAG TPA: alpha/beta fold hydrolase [Isosphaeraceae bacterium]|jgi:pimeloyl-ACP methyl ester carboxylesterase|nr:alpha/beta fold hydrolase [Isosphaeraceae bacterium]
MGDGRRIWRLLGVWASALLLGSGCASMRMHNPNPDLRPCTDAFATTADGWRLGIRHIRPQSPDPGKYPVVLCHGLGLNGSFWTITDNHLPSQLAARGYEVFVVDLRGSGASHRVGAVGQINRVLRQTPLNELGEGNWTMDDNAAYDVPAILNYVRAATGSPRVNWIGHSLGGMLLYPYLELSPERDRIANYVGMGATAILADVPQTDMLRANRGLRVLLLGMSTGRFARPMMFARLPGMSRIDQFYYSYENVDRRTISRFYGYTLENPGRGALKQLDPYLEFGHLYSADGKTDYSTLLGLVKTPTLLVAGDSDVMSDIASTQMTFEALGSPDRSLLRFGRLEGQVADYGHCDLVWSRHAPNEIFPVIGDWLDRHQPGSATGQEQSEAFSAAPALSDPAARLASQKAVDADLRPRLEPLALPGQKVDRDKPRLGQP